MMTEPTTVLVFGASRGVGLLLTGQLRARGVPVVAMLRPGSDADALLSQGVRVVPGNALAQGDVARAFAEAGGGCDVVSTLGGREGERMADDEGNFNVADQATACSVRRMVLVTSIGCGDMAPYRSERAIAAFGAAVDAKTRAELHLRRLLPSATILRPGGLKSDPPTGRGVLTRDPQMHGFIHRADVATLICRVLRDARTEGGCFAAVDAELAHCVNPLEPVSLDD